MGKTSIDGLTVRSSSTRRPHPAASATKNGRVVGDIITPARRRAVAPRESARASASIDADEPLRRRRNAAQQDDFLAPLESFAASEPDDSLGAVDEAAWSELLEGFGDSEAKHSDDLGLERRGASRANSNSSARRRSAAETLDEDETPKRRERKQQSKLPKKHHFKIKHPILMTIMIVLIALGVTGFVWGDSLISRLTNGQSGFWDAIGAMISNEVPFETDANGRTNVLVFGTEGYNMDGATDYVDREGSVSHDGAQLTDSIMIVSFDQKTKDVALISLPRDLKVPMACSAGKVNEVYWCNNRNGDNEEAGALALAEQLHQVLGIDFQYWAHVNWGALTDVIDTLGGITVTLDEDIEDYYYTKTVIKAGVPTRLSGLQAVALARARHGTVGGDFTRGNSQQKIMEGIIRELTANGVNITEAFNLLNILGDNLRSNFSTDNIKAGVKLLSSFDPSAIRNVLLVDYANNVYHVKTAMINGISYVVPQAGADNYKQIQAYIAQMLTSNPAAREGSQVAVYNGTETAGVASAEQTKLENDGFTVSHIGDTDSANCTEKYCVYALTDDMPATQAALAERYGVEIHPSVDLPWDINPGTADFVIVVGQAE